MFSDYVVRLWMSRIGKSTLKSNTEGPLSGLSLVAEKFSLLSPGFFSTGHRRFAFSTPSTAQQQLHFHCLSLPLFPEFPQPPWAFLGEEQQKVNISSSLFPKSQSQSMVFTQYTPSFAFSLWSAT